LGTKKGSVLGLQIHPGLKGMGTGWDRRGTKRQRRRRKRTERGTRDVVYFGNNPTHMGWRRPHSNSEPVATRRDS